MTTITTITIVPTEAFEILAEAATERTQDNARSGYQNLGSTNFFTSSQDRVYLINGQGGNDVITLFGDAPDTIYTGSGNDTVFAGEGDDFIFGGSGEDELEGYDGNDTISGGSGIDHIGGGIGTDKIMGGGGSDVLYGGAGVDTIYGGTGDDELFGDHDGSPTSQQGRDYLYGGFGNDKIHGGGNADTMFGDDGADQFIFDHVNDFVLGHSDVIRDFSRTEGDKIVLTAVDAIAGSGNQEFDFVGGPSTLAGTLWLGTVSNGQQRVFMNIDGGAADLDIIVKFDDANMTGLQESDFLL